MIGDDGRCCPVVGVVVHLADSVLEPNEQGVRHYRLAEM